MNYNNYSDSQNAANDALRALAITAVGQVVDEISPQAGLAYHLAATTTAQNDMGRLLGLLGMVGSGLKIIEQNKRTL